MTLPLGLSNWNNKVSKDRKKCFKTFHPSTWRLARLGGAFPQFQNSGGKGKRFEAGMCYTREFETISLPWAAQQNPAPKIKANKNNKR